MKGRPRRKVEFERVMGLRAWSAKELAPKLGMSLHVCRRLLRRYYDYGLLDRNKEGTTYFYVVTRFLQLPDKSYPCPRCFERMAVYRRKCGCVFQICTVELSHSLFSYCEKHRSESQVNTVQTKRR